MQVKSFVLIITYLAKNIAIICVEFVLFDATPYMHASLSELANINWSNI
jgi:hypothetical protein